MCFSFGDPGGKKATHAPSYVSMAVLIQVWHDYNTVISICTGTLFLAMNICINIHNNFGKLLVPSDENV